MKRKIFFPLLMVILLATIINNVKAPALYNDITLLTGHIHTHPQMQQIQMDNGKFVYIYILWVNGSPDTFDLHIYVYSASGSEDAHSVIDMQDLNDEPRAYTCVAVDADNIIVSVLVHDEINNNLAIKIVEYNTNSYVSNIYTSTDITESFNLNEGFGSELIPYGGEFYGIFTYLRAGVDEYSVSYKFNPSTNAVTKDTVDTTANLYGYTFYFFDTEAVEGANWVYLIAASRVAKTTALYLKWDLDNWTTEPELLATHPNPDDWDYDNVLSLTVSGGDILWNATESDYFLYWSWGIGEAADNDVNFVQNRLRFNSSGIDSLYLEAQNRMWYSVSLNTGSPLEESSIYLVLETEYNDLIMYTEIKYAEPSDFRIYELPFSISNWFDFGSSAISLGDDDFVDPLLFPVQGHAYIGYKGEDSGFMTSRKSTNTRVYYGLGVQGAWDITLTYSPADDPIETFTTYTFTGTLLTGAIPVSTDYIVYIDNVTLQAGVSSSQGEFVFNFLSTLSGLRTFTVEMYFSGILVYSEDFEYVFASVDEDQTTTGGLLQVGIAAVMAFLPVFIIVLFPPMLFFFITKNLIVFFAVLCLCSYVGVMSGMVPTYVMFLVILLSCLFFYLEFNKGGNP